METACVHPIEPKTFFRRMESMLDRVPLTVSARHFAEVLLPLLLEEFGEALGVIGAELIDRGAFGTRTLRRMGVGQLSPDALAHLAQVELPWSDRLSGGAVGIFAMPEPAGLLVALHFSADAPGGLAPFGTSRIQTVVAALHNAVDHHLRRHRFQNQMEQARAIQRSLLPDANPAFGAFDIAAFELTAETVGGDLYDFSRMDQDTLSIAIADAAGHGLPAALQARDVATGLRMGVERDLGLPRMLEQLNRVIHRSGLSSRFVSLVLGELGKDGTFCYINAGHPPPLLVDHRGTHELTIGGMILGPDPAAHFRVGIARLDPGASLLLFTDGVVECGAGRGHPFGVERLAAWLARSRGLDARCALADLVLVLRAHAPGPLEDDMTAVLITRPD